MAVLERTSPGPALPAKKNEAQFFPWTLTPSKPQVAKGKGRQRRATEHSSGGSRKRLRLSLPPLEIDTLGNLPIACANEQSIVGDAENFVAAQATRGLDFHFVAGLSIDEGPGNG